MKPKPQIDPNAQELAEKYSSETLEQALELRHKFEIKQRRTTPRMRHFERRADGSLRIPSGKFRYAGGIDNHVCIPECGMYNDKEANALLSKER